MKPVFRASCRARRPSRQPGRRLGRALILAVLASSLGTHAARSHTEPYSHLELRLEPDGWHGTLVAHVVDLAHEAGIAHPESLLEAAVVERDREPLERMLAAHLIVLVDGDTLRPEWRSFEIVRDRRSVAFAWTAPQRGHPRAVQVEGPLFPYDPPHETYVNLYRDGRLVLQDLLDHGHRVARHAEKADRDIAATIRTFLFEGIHHIFIGPDHILFVIGLLLLGGSLLRLLKIVTAFTLAHTVTLALATLRIVDPPPRLIEPLIALSIVVIGIETLRSLGSGRDRRARIAFAFGLVHGFGFAGVLREFGLPAEAVGVALASFNVGVEVGQASIVLAAAPLLALVRSAHPERGRRVITAGACVIMLAGGYWLVQRLFFTA